VIAELNTRIAEMSNKFPDASFLGIDLAPTWRDLKYIPDNASFELCNVIEGIPTPDNTFDIVHARAIAAGVNSAAVEHEYGAGSVDQRLGTTR
jgi:hypothetical protein